MYVLVGLDVVITEEGKKIEQPFQVNRQQTTDNRKLKKEQVIETFLQYWVWGFYFANTEILNLGANFTSR